MSKPKKGKRFRYPLESLLKVRKIRENQEQEKFKKAEEKVIEEKRKEQELIVEQSREYEEMLEMMRGDVPDMGEIIRRKAHLEALKDKIEAQIKVREEAEKARDNQREVLIKTVKERKIIEKDREKTREAWKKMMDKEAGKFLDDISSVGHVRKMREQAAE